jgi:hypothetical protein
MSAPGSGPRKGVGPAFLLLILSACGCGDGIPRVPVEGTVLVDDVPLRGATGAVTFLGESATAKDNAPRASGTIDREGRYVLFTQGKPGVPPGRYKVLVTAVPLGAERDDTRLAVHPRYAAEQSSPLTVEVVRAPEAGHYDLKLTRR